MRRRVKYAILKSTRVINSEEIMRSSLLYWGVLRLVSSMTISLMRIFLKRRLEISMWIRKMKERGRISVEVIWVKIFLHESMILEASLYMSKNPRNCISSCSLSMMASEKFVSLYWGFGLENCRGGWFGEDEQRGGCVGKRINECVKGL